MVLILGGNKLNKPIDNIVTDKGLTNIKPCSTYQYSIHIPAIECKKFKLGFCQL